MISKKFLSVMSFTMLTGCAGMPALWNHASPPTTTYNELGVSRGFEENPEKIRDPVLKTVVPEGVQEGGSYLLQTGPLVLKLHSDPATSFWFGLASTSYARYWGFTFGLDVSITPWPQIFEYRYDTVTGLLGAEYPVVVKRTGRFSAYALPMQFELRPTKYFVPIFAFTPVATGVSSTSTVDLVEPFDEVADYDLFLRSNLDEKRREERKRDKIARYMLVGGLGVRSQLGKVTLKLMYIDRRLDSFHLRDHFGQMFHLAAGISTGSAANRPSPPAPRKPQEKPRPSPSPSAPPEVKQVPEKNPQPADPGAR